jgi:hypothetical protein
MKITKRNGIKEGKVRYDKQGSMFHKVNMTTVVNYPCHHETATKHVVLKILQKGLFYLTFFLRFAGIRGSISSPLTFDLAIPVEELVVPFGLYCVFVVMYGTVHFPRHVTSQISIIAEAR